MWSFITHQDENNLDEKYLAIYFKAITKMEQSQALHLFYASVKKEKKGKVNHMVSLVMFVYVQG